MTLKLVWLFFVICATTDKYLVENGSEDVKLDEDGDVELTGDICKSTTGHDESENQTLIHPEKDDAVLVLTDHTNETLAVAASPIDITCLITGGMDDIGIIWDLNEQSYLTKIDGADDSVSTVSFSNDGKFAAFGSENGAISIVILDGTTSPSSVLDGPGDAIHFLSWHPRGPVLLAGSADHLAYMWNAAKGRFMMAFAGHEDAVTCGAFSADGKVVVTASNDSSLRIWNPSSGETITRFQTGISGLRSVFHNAGILCLSAGSSGNIGEKLIATGCADGDVFISHRENNQVVSQLPRHEGGVETIAFSPASSTRTFLASAGADGIIHVWDVESSMERISFSHGGVVAKIVWHPSKPILLSGSSDGSAILWNVLSGEMLTKLTGHTGFITDVCFAGDSKLVASTSADSSVRIYDACDVLSSVR